MNEQERLARFREGMKALEQQTGVRLVPALGYDTMVVGSAQLPMMQIKASLEFELTPDWIPVETKAPEPGTNGNH